MQGHTKLRVEALGNAITNLIDITERLIVSGFVEATKIKLKEKEVQRERKDGSEITTPTCSYRIDLEITEEYKKELNMFKSGNHQSAQVFYPEQRQEWSHEKPEAVDKENQLSHRETNTHYKGHSYNQLKYDQTKPRPNYKNDKKT